MKNPGASEEKVQLAVIGGSGLYELDGAQKIQEHWIQTPFGKTSDAIIQMEVQGQVVYFLPRHGRGHKLLPSEVNYKANIYALKELGVTHILSVSAVGIMTESIAPGDMIIPDQIFDRTKGRPSSFFGEGLVGHVSFADPFCLSFLKDIQAASTASGARTHLGGTYLAMEGPQFSTRAESNFYRKTLSPVAIGMTALPEAKLAREAEICYGLLALGTDYDCWKTDESVTVEAVLAVLKANSEMAKRIVLSLSDSLYKNPTQTPCKCRYAARNALVTRSEDVPNATKEKVALLYQKYF